MSDVKTRIDEMVKGNQVVLFMKGSPEIPQCGFSMRISNMVRALGVPFLAVNVLDDYDIRQGIKSYSDWPTIPQLYIDGNFVGGSDICAQMFEAGELQKLVSAK